MSKKNRSAKKADPGNAQDFNINPFSGLSKRDLGVGTGKADMALEYAGNEVGEDAEIDDRGKELMAPFAEGGLGKDIPASGKARGTISLQAQRKGRGGKTVTRVHGVNGLSLSEEMELVGQLKKGLGTGAHFRDGIIELHGDLGERAGDWFRKHGFRVKD